MPKKQATDFEYLANDPNYVPDPEIEEFVNSRISGAERPGDACATAAK